MDSVEIITKMSTFIEDLATKGKGDPRATVHLVLEIGYKYPILAAEILDGMDDEIRQLNEELARMFVDKYPID